VILVKSGVQLSCICRGALEACLCRRQGSGAFTGDPARSSGEARSGPPDDVLARTAALESVLTIPVMGAGKRLGLVIVGPSTDVDSLRVPGNHHASQNSSRTSERRARVAIARWRLGGIDSLSVIATDPKRVDQ
jgi:hypothetical protein